MVALQARRLRERVHHRALMLRQAIQRVQESQVWRDLIFSPVREQGPRLLHGDLWLGNMAVDTQRRPYVVGPASWFGPSDYDLAVGETFGMPQRFRQAYEYYCPKLEGSEQRAMLYKLYILLNHLNQPASYKFSSNVRREPLSVPRVPRLLPCEGRAVTCSTHLLLTISCRWLHGPCAVWFSCLCRVVLMLCRLVLMLAGSATFPTTYSGRRL